MNTNTRALFIALAIAGASGGPTTSDAQETSIAPSVVNLDVVSDVPDLKALTACLAPELEELTRAAAYLDAGAA